MKEVSAELVCLRKTKKNSRVNGDSDLEETEFVLGETSECNKNDDRNKGIDVYDSVGDHVISGFDNGR